MTLEQLKKIRLEQAKHQMHQQVRKHMKLANKYASWAEALTPESADWTAYTALAVLYKSSAIAAFEEYLYLKEERYAREAVEIQENEAVEAGK